MHYFSDILADFQRLFSFILLKVWKFLIFIGKARRLKQAKDEATEEIEKYRQEREKQFKDFEAKVSKS